MSQFTTCDSCEKRLDDPVPFKITHSVNASAMLPEFWTKTFDVCSTACLMRLASELHRPPVAPSDELEAMP